MPDQPLLVPGLGAQGGRPEALAAAFGGRSAGVLAPASRSIMYADDPVGAAARLREAVWSAWLASERDVAGR
jgi:orotidine-5'-phosphate decarboxylase